jgi:hypothetical protein
VPGRAVRRHNAEYPGPPAGDRYGLDTLTWAERVIYGPLIRGQLKRNPQLDQALEKNGPAAMARLCSARTLLSFEFILAVVAAVLAISGTAAAAAVFGCLFLLFGALSGIRAMSATRAQKRWRAEHQGIQRGGV